MNIFVAIAFMNVWGWFLNNPIQTPAVSDRQSLLVKRAVTDTQRIFASELDAELPRLPFADWFGKVVGSKAGVIWQLTECGEQGEASSNSSGDVRACAEVNAILPDNRKVVVMISVGTFRKGVTGAPAFYYGVIERQEELYLVRRLRDLPELLREPGSLFGVKLPAVELPRVKVMNEVYTIRSQIWSGRGPSLPTTIEASPPPPPPQVVRQSSVVASQAEHQETSEELGRVAANGSPKLLGAVSWGDAITKVQPRYPANAKRVNASGPVDVQVTISEAGRVIEAKAISGHSLLRNAAEEAARQWIFKPAILNGVPVETQIVLTFNFRPPR